MCIGSAHAHRQKCVGRVGGTAAACGPRRKINPVTAHCCYDRFAAQSRQCHVEGIGKAHLPVAVKPGTGYDLRDALFQPVPQVPYIVRF